MSALRFLNALALTCIFLGAVNHCFIEDFFASASSKGCCGSERSQSRTTSESGKTHDHGRPHHLDLTNSDRGENVALPLVASLLSFTACIVFLCSGTLRLANGMLEEWRSSRFRRSDIQELIASMIAAPIAPPQDL